MRALATRAVLPLSLVATAISGCSEEPPSEHESRGEVESVDLSDAGSEVVEMRHGFAFPESAVYDPEQDAYFVSNINGLPSAKDDNGYISRIDAETGDIVPKWIDGAKVNVTLHGPRWLTLEGDSLIAADVDSVRWFSRQTGEAQETVAVPNSIFLNDVFAAPDGSVYVTDSAMPGKTEGIPAPAVDAVYRLTGREKVEQFAAGQTLHRPDGAWVYEGEIWIAAFGSAELYRISNGEKADVQTLPKGVLDGLMFLDNGIVLVSSWDGNGIYAGRIGQEFRLIIREVNSPADFGLDTRRNLLIIPHLEENVVTLHPLRIASSE